MSRWQKNKYVYFPKCTTIPLWWNNIVSGPWVKIIVSNYCFQAQKWTSVLTCLILSNTGISDMKLFYPFRSTAESSTKQRQDLTTNLVWFTTCTYNLSDIILCSTVPPSSAENDLLHQRKWLLQWGECSASTHQPQPSTKKTKVGPLWDDYSSHRAPLEVTVRSGLQHSPCNWTFTHNAAWKFLFFFFF